MNSLKISGFNINSKKKIIISGSKSESNRVLILKYLFKSDVIIDNLSKKGNPIFKFSKPKIKDYDFSFSGLKTNVLYFLRKEQEKNKNFIKENIHHLCASIQKIIVITLVNKLKRAIIMNNVKNVAIAGGVASNKYFRSEIKKLENELKIKSYFPKIEYSTDNAAMIAWAGIKRFKKNLSFDTFGAILFA